MHLRKLGRVVSTIVAVVSLLLSPNGIGPLSSSAQPAPSSNGQLLTPAALDALLAPIALYPDTLLSQVLMASTYPLEVVQAARWVKANRNLQGDALKTAVDTQSWDDSVKSLVATPDVLAMMSDRLDWTQKLGDAVLAQEPDVMDAIQRLRARAQAAHKLNSTDQQKVVVDEEQGGPVIAIDQVDPDMLYVPYYDPSAVYGDWPYPDYPPFYFPPPFYVAGGLIAAGIVFGGGCALRHWAFGGHYWRGGVNWRQRNIMVNRPINTISTNTGITWQHDPEHRHGVRYGNPAVQQRFSNTGSAPRPGVQERMEFRGRSGEQVLHPGGTGPSPAVGTPPAGANRAGNLGPVNREPFNRPAAPPNGLSNRPSGGWQGPVNVPHPPREGAFTGIQSGAITQFQSQRGQASLGARMAPGGRNFGGGGFRGGGAPAVGGGGFHGGGGGGGRGGRPSDAALKQDVTLLGHIDENIGFYSFSYYGSRKTYVGVLAQEVMAVRPDAIRRGKDGYLRVDYDLLGIPFQTYARWRADGAHIPHLIPQ